MGTTETEKLGYSGEALDVWAKRARPGRREERRPISPPSARPAAKAAARDVFLYVISGFKALNPAAAMGLIERLR